MEETRQERSLGNYEKYLKQWDDYENSVEKHFKL